MITDEQLRQLAASGEFQELLQNDEHIKKLEALKYNPRDEYIALSDVLGWNPMFRSLKLNRLTPALWAFLWTLRSPYTQEEMYKADELDTDIFLYLLTVDLREGDVSPKKIVIAAIGFCRKHGICWQEARAWLCERVHFAFRAGGMLPRTDSWSDNAHVFDADWLTFFCSHRRPARKFPWSCMTWDLEVVVITSSRLCAKRTKSGGSARGPMRNSANRFTSILFNWEKNFLPEKLK